MTQGPGFRVQAVALILLLAVTAAAWSQDLKISHRSAAQVTGSLAGTEVAFSAVETSPDRFILVIELPGARKVRAEIDDVTGAYSIKSMDEISNLVALTEEDLTGLRALQKTLGIPPSKLEEKLARILLLLSEYPPGETVDLSSEGESVIPIFEEQYTSLCSIAGSFRKGTYTIGTTTYNETVQVGPCYNKSNQCMGRCGPGCDSLPALTFQLFTQECLNHDLCTKATGDIFGECSDEWRAAADGYVRAPDCASLSGKWIDNYSFQWNLKQAGQRVTGNTAIKRQGYTCDYLVTGTHNGTSVKLTAKIKRPRKECCRSFTYTGTASGCTGASGTWANVCTLQGNWQMQRSGKTAQQSLLPEENTHEIPGPASPGPSNR